jgi:molecular chaperone HtpG
MSATAAQPEKMEFKTELKQLLHLITHSLYSNKEIFLRELISNASDAINKLKFDSLDHEDRLEGNKDWKIKIAIDKDAGTLTVSDNGIGLTRETAVENLGTIAKSGTRAYLEQLKQQQQAGQRPELIGQFGVGFYSAFMVADRVTVLSRAAGSAEGIRWESDGQGEFTIEPFDRPARGTDVILHLKESEKEFLDPWRVRSVVKKFSDFLEHPVVMDTVEEEEGGEKKTVEETINSRKAIWLRSKSDNTDEEYREFYKSISSDYNDPARWIHYTAEGNQEFRVVAFLPAEKPFGMQFGEYEWGLRLYIQRVLIMDHCEALLPGYLRFVKGVVDSSDLPLNISRELLQENPRLEQIKSNVTRALLKAIDDYKTSDYEGYVKWFKEFGPILKEGPGRDYANRDKIADLFLFESAKTPAGQFATLEKYIEAMPEGQEAIYYLTGDTREQLEHSPYMESYREKGQDVLLLTDPIDEYMISNLSTFKGKKLEAADRAVASDTVEASEKEKYAKLLEAMKAKLPEVADVRLTSRLKESAAFLVTEGHMSANMERLMQRMGRDEAGTAKRILELNGAHPVVANLLRLVEKDPADARIESHARTLYDLAVIAEGSRIKDPSALAKRIAEMLVKDAG